MALQAQQIVALATQMACAPGFTNQAGQLLNMVLSGLCQQYDFDVAKQSTKISLGSVSTNYGAGPYVLPANYLRTLRDEVFYVFNGVPYPLVPVDLAEFDQFPMLPGNNSLPSMYATDMSQSPPQLWVWPPPAGLLPLTVRYYCQMPDIATPETSGVTPWFPNQDFLVTRLAGELMKLTDDDRSMAFIAKADETLDGYLKMKDDSLNRAMTVKLDRRMFTPGWAKLPNTKRLGW
jgi:hypothetical protein